MAGALSMSCCKLDGTEKLWNVKTFTTTLQELPKDFMLFHFGWVQPNLSGFSLKSMQNV